eukprot:jgi/Tetstr1/423457/TSEL_014138.t1
MAPCGGSQRPWRGVSARDMCRQIRAVLEGSEPEHAAGLSRLAGNPEQVSEAIVAGYGDAPYHNVQHALYVTRQTRAMMSGVPGDVLDGRHRIAAALAAAALDMFHPGGRGVDLEEVSARGVCNIMRKFGADPPLHAAVREIILNTDVSRAARLLSAQGGARALGLPPAARGGVFPAGGGAALSPAEHSPEGGAAAAANIAFIEGHDRGAEYPGHAAPGRQACTARAANPVKPCARRWGPACTTWARRYRIGTAATAPRAGGGPPAGLHFEVPAQLAERARHLSAEDTRVSNPPSTMRGAGANRWAPLCEEPQEHALEPFSRAPTNDRRAAKDSHTPCATAPLGESGIMPPPGAPDFATPPPLDPFPAVPMLPDHIASPAANAKPAAVAAPAATVPTENTDLPGPHPNSRGGPSARNAKEGRPNSSAPMTAQ